MVCIIMLNLVSPCQMQICIVLNIFHWLAHSFTHSLPHQLTHFTGSLTHSLIHSLTNSLIRSLTTDKLTNSHSLTWNNFKFRLYLAQYEFYDGCLRI